MSPPTINPPPPLPPPNTVHHCPSHFLSFFQNPPLGLAELHRWGGLVRWDGLCSTFSSHHTMVHTGADRPMLRSAPAGAVMGDEASPSLWSALPALIPADSSPADCEKIIGSSWLSSKAILRLGQVFPCKGGIFLRTYRDRFPFCNTKRSGLIWARCDW